MDNIAEYLLIQAQNQPNKLFCVDDESEFTFKQALDMATKIAYVLNNLGLKNQPIMLKAERDNKTLISMLGIILSNNYYVPVNPQFAQEKVESIIETSNLKYEICFGETTTNLTPIFYADALKTQPPVDMAKKLLGGGNLNNNIYTIYTSGSTGKPKGVLKTQKNILAFVQNFLQTFNFIEDLKIANQAPLFFDASMKDVYLALATGATIYFPNKTLFSMPLKLVEYLNANQINYICWVPSALTIIVRLKTFNYIKPQFLKYVFFVGEVFMPKYLNIWLNELPNVMYVNVYGSTELAGVCLYKVIDHILPEDKPIPLGKPLKNNKVFLLDNEIVVQSDQIASGYLNDPEKNAQVFAEIDGERALKTGDFAFVNEDGDIVFSTRKDFQIKHMGYRIELQEIEIAVSALPMIGTCAVLFDTANDKIVCFASLSQQIDNPTKAIITALKANLPAYMVPNRVEILPELPLNANGKIDRTKLKSLI